MRNRYGKMVGIVGVGAIVLAGAGVFYHRHQQAVRHRESVQDFRRGIEDARQAQWTTAIMELRHAQRLFPTGHDRRLLRLVEKLQGKTTGIQVQVKREGQGGYIHQVYIASVASDSSAQKAGLTQGDILLGGSLKKSQAASLFLSDFYFALDFRSLVDNASVGHPIYLDVQSSHKKDKVIAVQVVGARSGVQGVWGFFQQGSEAIQLPTLRDQGIPYGWIPSSESGSNESDLTFMDPMDPQVAVAIIWSDFPGTLAEDFPPSATVLHRHMQFSGLPAIMYRDVTQTNGTPVTSEGLVVQNPVSRYSSAKFSSTSLIMSAPQAQWAHWQPIFNDMLNTFIPNY